MQILEKAQALLERTKTPSEMCRIYLQRIDHIYFKFDPRVIQQRHVSIFEHKFDANFRFVSTYDDKICPAVSS